jgi:phosphatidylinositol-3-phosphatase
LGITRSRIGVVAFALTVALVGCASAGSRLPAQRIASPTARVVGGVPSHLAVVVMENEEYSGVIGSRAAPYINRLAHGYALAISSYAISHPSLPNYLALTGGLTFGIDSDCTDCAVRGTGIVGQLESRGISWKAYMEDLPHACFTGSGAGAYAKKHDPFVYYKGIVTNPARCSRVVPMTQLTADERSGALPQFIWITPNLCHDMHACDRATGDRFLSRLVPPLLRALGPRGLLILTWDEGSSDNGCCRLAGGGHIATIVAGGDARRNVRLKAPVDHYSVLQTIEDLFGLRRRRGAACTCTPSLQPLLRRR